jgi:hypothetical protein
MTKTQREQTIERLGDLFASDLTKVALSGLILLSLVLPAGLLDRYGILFFGLFSLEIAIRALVLRRDYQRQRLSRVDLIFLALDIVATISFLPIHLVWDDARLLRLFRLSRMLLLLDYWGQLARELWFILTKRERLYQIAFVVITVLILTVSSALVLEYFQVQGIDFNSDGNPNNDRSFWSMLWWSFLQLESADNLLKDANASLGFFFSFSLTVSGLFLFSFLVGIGNSVVQELVALSKQRRLGINNHTLICNVSPYSGRLLRELVSYYTKSLRSPRIVAMGPAEQRPDHMLEPPLLRIRYRQGQPLSRHDLQKVDADRATRIILLNQTEQSNSDSEIVSQVLSVREVNRECPIYVELLRSDSIPAALQAGNLHTVPVMANRLVSMYMANLVVFPGIEPIFRELLSPAGDEIYTCIYDRGAMAGRQAPAGPLTPFGDLVDACHRKHGVILLGHLRDDESEPAGVAPSFCVGPSASAPDRLRGFVGLAANFEHMRSCVTNLPPLVPAATPEEPAPRFAVCPGAFSLRSFFIGGFHEGLVDFCEELILFSGLEEIIIMVPKPELIPSVLDAFLHRSEEPPSATTQGGLVRFTPVGELELAYAKRNEPQPIGRLRVLTGDWSDDYTLRGGAAVGHRLENLDAVLLTYQPGESDPDARTALAALKLLQLREQKRGALKPSFRLFCEFQHGEKAALFQRRFCQPGGRCGDVTVISAESMRNAFMAQAVFVPGIVTVYRELLSKAGVSLCKLLPQPTPNPHQTLTFGQLLSTLRRRDDMLAVGVELDDAKGRRVVLNPPPGSPDYHFKASELVGLYALGDFERLPQAPTCAACFLRSSG